jgi:hypothetical protein
LQELKGILRIADGEMKKSSSNLMIQEGGSRIKKIKRKATPKVALKYKSKGKMVPNQNTPKAKDSSTSDYFCCQNKGHWKRNCPKYLEVVRTRNILKNSTLDIFVVEINVVTSIHNWVLDTGSCAHICANMEALKNRRKLLNKEIQLRVENGAQVTAVTVESIELYLPRGLIMKLENIYFIPSISRNIISISYQEMNDFFLL